MTSSSTRPRGLVAILVAGMALALVPGPALGILSRFLIDDLGLTRTEIGLAATSYAFIEALASLPLGNMADRIGGRRMLVLVLLFSAVGVLGMAGSWGLVPLLAFSGLAGLAPAGANPATNHLIVQHVPPGSRGWITGIKQSGVQAGIFLAGLSLPAAAVGLGWRWAFGLVSVTALVAVVATTLVVPHDRVAEAASGPPGRRVRLPRAILWLAVFGGLMGLGVAAYSTYLPLYAQEDVGLSVQLAGGVMAVFGIVGLVARIAWGRIAEKVGHPSGPLTWIAGLSLLSAGLIWAASPTAPFLIWVGAAAAGMGSVSWMSVGMLAVMTILGPERTGRGSAAVTLGFAVGLTIGPVTFGWAVDSFEGYDVALAALVAIFALASLLMMVWNRIERGRARLFDENI